MQGFSRPAATAVNAGSAFFSEILDYFPDNKKRAEQIEALRQKIARLRMEAVRNQELAVENQRLRELLELETAPDWIVRTARVNSKDPLTWNRRFEIDKGSADGVIEGAGVVTGTALAGRVEDVSEHTSTVLTVLDPLCSLSVRLTETDALAVMEGRQTVREGRSLCRLNYLSPDTEFKEDMEVVTSGLSRVVPGGLKVGWLKPWDGQREFNNDSTIYKQALLEPEVRFGDFHFVRVIYKSDAREN